ncbi:MAG: OmpA family protein [Hyphomicrobiales bacterium]|nr:OmpA family protein [Hyphomicrobiales bacterium]MCP4997934.1 OmpA family protein [Hyphomicrobiales bacterium]
MRRTLLSATSALALALSHSGGLSLATAVVGGAMLVTMHGAAQAQDLDAANAAVEAAKAALEEAKANGEGVKVARQALKAARAERKRIVAAQKATAEEEEERVVEVEEIEEEEEETAEEEPEPEPEEEVAEQEEEPEEPEVESAEESSEEDPESEPAVSKADKKKAEKDKKKATRKAKRKAERKARKEATENEAASRSPDAPEAKPLAEAPIEEQIEEAAEKPASVLPDDVSKSQRQQLRAAERQRRKEARKNRQELLGAAGVGAVVGALIPALGGRVVEDEGDRLVVERDGRFYVRKDESALFRDNGQNIEVERMRSGRTRETIYRPNGSKIITVRDPGGYALRRVKVKRNGERVVLFDIREDRDRRAVNYDRDLPPVRVNIPRDQYIVSGGRYGRSGLAEILSAPPVEQVTTGYSLREVRESDRLRSMVRRVDLDTITFDTGSPTVRASQVPYLANVAGGMLDVMDNNPAAVFLIEGHTDAVGSDVYNLTLSDRRAETVARILIDAFDVPPENLVVQGYGEQYLKIDTDGDERRNRRVAIRNITPLLTASSN